jgi:hypothetical protein
MFKTWSENNQNAKEILRPNLGVRSWSELSQKDKEIIWRHFVNKGWFAVDEETYNSIYSFNEDNKARAFCNHLLNHGGPHYIEIRGIKQYMEKCCWEAALLDFKHIFYTEHQDVVYELFSYYVLALQRDTLDKEKVTHFKNLFNDISNQFGLDILMTKESFIPRQDKKIIKEIYEPVLDCLSDQKWKKVNEILSDAFSDYIKNTPQEYSGCVTKTISAVEAYLQILVDGEIGKTKLSSLISEGQKNNLIPNDVFTQTIFKNIETIFARERKSTGDAHPKDEYATEKDARTILNLAMIFIQHCIQK